MPPPTKDAAESLEELVQFLEYAFRLGRTQLAPAEWRRLLGQESAALCERFLTNPVIEDASISLTEIAAVR